MRDAIGSTWVFSICLTFIMIFTAYLAITINYAKAFRIKNYIVSYIEENEGYGNKYYDNMEDSIEEYLYNQGYSATGRCKDSIEEADGSVWLSVAMIDFTDDAKLSPNLHNVCIYRLDAYDEKDKIYQRKAYYKVATFFKFELPIFGNMPGFEVSGNSRIIYDFRTS